MPREWYHRPVSAIGGLNETHLHEQLKHLYAGVGGRTEQDVDGFIVDVVRDEEIVEIQTRGLGRLRRKIETLGEHRRIRIVHPIAIETLITRLSAGGEITSSRRSPRHGRVEEVFREVASIADLLPHRHVVIEAALVRVVETRIDDGQGSWRRRGVSIVARQLGAVVAVHELCGADDYLALLPNGLNTRFSNTDLMRTGNLRYRDAQPMTSSLRKMGLLRVVGASGRERVYERVANPAPASEA